MKPVTKTCRPLDTYPVEANHVPEKFMLKAERELFETPGNRKVLIEDLKRMIRDDETMEEEWFSDEDILMYLRSRKFNVGKAFTSLKTMVSFVKKHRKYFGTLDLNIFDEVVKSKVFQLLPRRDSDGCAIGLIKLGKWNPSKIGPDEVLHCGTLMLLHELSNPMTQINGVKCIYDFKNGSFKYIRYITSYIYMLYQLIIECVPMRIKAVYVINPTVITKIIFSIVTAMCSEKLKKRIHIHDKETDVLNYMQPNVVPDEFGGLLSKEETSSYVWAKTLSVPNYVAAILESTKSS